MKVVIMAGGKGLRFWPRSVETKPKQFLALTSNESMLQQTYQRFSKYVDVADIYVVAGSSYIPLIREQLPLLDPSRMIVEPYQRDTGPCMALTARFFLQQELDDVIVTTPSDQYIPDDAELMNVLREAEMIARKDESIVTLGIVPTRPETGFGYIRADANSTLGQAKRVLRFVEKPNEQRAREFMKEPNMYWNSGIFIWKPSTINYYMKLHQSEMWNKLWLSDLPLEHVYASLPRLSVDYAILEKAERVYTIPVHFVWDDVGSWNALERVFPTDERGNLFFGDVHSLHATNSIIYAEGQKVVAIGVNDLIIVSTKDGLLVCPKSEEQNIKLAISMMEASK
ncbi:mannose-1-phosphate guanylyltransferase [Paenibacillus aceris]|uniref:Mannose-1-phosphate guanylyltransferase n=1 Tax=Paenibacillus aceris TaxID=869555 RepID=A0ABS4I7Q9_9BACL|nr:sugar phosphate nucleotidyltransferase [Paenibacillus aceris]MBP1966964.1 mannose-1-phosphate guanylyltransferase [Paenibacillus aceris]NHW39328.1 mannose-1-phosphate guanylyltransferase [Paenibacillus aceris]